ncbi:hypothetical protein HPB47_024773 [Ixodes persulcatus]|uniref:Uncharacterized protein n=1 Tax=Ixodes persulcatus TaxID=34615 RepID=A0AC60Q3H2_IXOPE|nr:hypothetical protein HPB47_024773 [Ixodes persulcatus]
MYGVQHVLQATTAPTCDPRSCENRPPAVTSTRSFTAGTCTAGFLLAPTFLFFAGDDRPVVDLLRLDLRLLLFPDVAFLALDILVVALAPLVLERDDGRCLVRLLVLRFAGVAEDDLERLLEAAALFLLRPRTREEDAMEAPSPTPLVDAGSGSLEAQEPISSPEEEATTSLARLADIQGESAFLFGAQRRLPARFRLASKQHSQFVSRPRSHAKTA